MEREWEWMNRWEGKFMAVQDQSSLLLSLFIANSKFRTLFLASLQLLMSLSLLPLSLVLYGWTGSFSLPLSLSLTRRMDRRTPSLEWSQSIVLFKMRCISFFLSRDISLHPTFVFFSLLKLIQANSLLPQLLPLPFSSPSPSFSPLSLPFG